MLPAREVSQGIRVGVRKPAPEGTGGYVGGRKFFDNFKQCCDKTKSRGSATMALAACLHGNYSYNGLRQTPYEPFTAWGQPTQWVIFAADHDNCLNRNVAEERNVE